MQENSKDITQLETFDDVLHAKRIELFIVVVLHYELIRVYISKLQFIESINRKLIISCFSTQYLTGSYYCRLLIGVKANYFCRSELQFPFEHNDLSVFEGEINIICRFSYVC